MVFGRYFSTQGTRADGRPLGSVFVFLNKEAWPGDPLPSFPVFRNDSMVQKYTNADIFGNVIVLLFTLAGILLKNQGFSYLFTSYEQDCGTNIDRDTQILGTI